MTLSRRLGFETEAGRVLRATGLKWPIETVRILRHEIDRLTGSAVPARRPARAAVEVRLHAALVATAGALRSGSLAALGPLAADLTELQGRPDGLRALPPETRRLAERILALASAGESRRSSWVGWREAVRLGRVHDRAEYAVTLGAIAGDQTGSRTWTERALRSRARRAAAPSVYPALAQLLGVPSENRERRRIANCSALAPSSDYIRVDCAATAFTLDWSRGDIDGAARAYRHLRDRGWPHQGPPLTTLAREVLSFLRLAGASAEFNRLHAMATRHAAAAGDDILVGWLAAARIARMRAAGRTAEAVEMWERAHSEGPVTALLLIEGARVASAAGMPDEARRHLARATGRLVREDDRARHLLARIELAPETVSPDDWDWLADLDPPRGLDPDEWAAILRAGRDETRDSRLPPAGEMVPARHETRMTSSAPTTLDAMLADAIRRDRARELLSWGQAEAALASMESADVDSRDGEVIEHLRQHLAPTDALLVVRRLGAEVAVWVVRAGRVESRIVAEAAGILSRLELLAALLQSRVDNSGWEALAASLGERLFGFAEATLSGARRIVVIADPELSLVPVDLLTDTGNRGRNRPAVLQVGSAARLDAAWHRRSRPFDESVAFIPGTGRPALREAALMLTRPIARVFHGRAATAQAFRASAPRAGVVHFGGHTVRPTSLLDGGGLVFGTAGPRTPRLAYREIAGLPLDGALVVLMGCDTAGPATGAALRRTLADAFLAAGSRAVVGNVWSIRDDEAAALAEVFYEQGGPEAGPEALRRTKEVMRARHPGRTAGWAGLVWHGAPPTEP